MKNFYGIYAIIFVTLSVFASVSFAKDNKTQIITPNIKVQTPVSVSPNLTAGVFSSNTNGNQNSNTNSNANNNTNNNSNSNRNGLSAITSAVSGSSSGVNSSGNSTVNIQNQRVASPAIAPNLSHSYGIDSCMGSTTGAVQGLSLGVSVGSTWNDKHCEAIRAAVRLNELGYTKSAAQRLCQIPEIAQAFEDSGEITCKKSTKRVQSTDEYLKNN
jgi:hypothetical protein